MRAARCGQAAAEKKGRQDQQGSQQRRKRTNRKFTAAEQLDPEMERNVIERRVNVVGCTSGDGQQVTRRQGNAGSLIIPQTLRLNAV